MYIYCMYVYYAYCNSYNFLMITSIEANIPFIKIARLMWLTAEHKTTFRSTNSLSNFLNFIDFIFHVASCNNYSLILNKTK